jgi:hypothetical protein
MRADERERRRIKYIGSDKILPYAEVLDFSTDSDDEN